MYFFDTIKNNFLVYKKNGEFIQSFGRTGRGPLEFQLVYGYTVDAENNLYVYDDAQRQIKIFDNQFQLHHILDVDNTQYFIFNKIQFVIVYSDQSIIHRKYGFQCIFIARVNRNMIL